MMNSDALKIGNIKNETYDLIVSDQIENNNMLKQATELYYKSLLHSHRVQHQMSDVFDEMLKNSLDSLSNKIPEIPESLKTSETHEIPEISKTPEVPEIPEISETYEIPEISDTPEIQEISEISEAPEISDTPEIPGISEISETPEVPEVCETPEIPEIINEMQESIDHDYCLPKTIENESKMIKLSCTKCEFVAKSPSALVTHFKSHRQCEICGQKFKGQFSSTYYKNHMGTHKVKTGKIYNCDLCNKAFKYMSYYERHKPGCLKKSVKSKVLSLSDL